MTAYELIISRRSIRRFDQERKIPRHLIDKMLNAARLAPSAANLQPLKYMIVDQAEDCERLFQCTKWAGYLPREVGTPKPGERPPGYIIILVDTEISKNGYEIDVGAAAQNITLTALEEGIGCCWIGALDRKKIKEYFDIGDRYIVDLVLALGYPKEQPVVEDAEDGNIRYFRDEKGVHHVPKRTMQEIVWRP